MFYVFVTDADNVVGVPLIRNETGYPFISYGAFRAWALRTLVTFDLWYLDLKMVWQVTFVSGICALNLHFMRFLILELKRQTNRKDMWRAMINARLRRRCNDFNSVYMRFTYMYYAVSVMLCRSHFGLLGLNSWQIDYRTVTVGDWLLRYSFSLCGQYTNDKVQANQVSTSSSLIRLKARSDRAFTPSASTLLINGDGHTVLPHNRRLLQAFLLKTMPKIT